MSSIDIANKSDEWMFDLEEKAKQIGLNRREQKQYMKLEEIRDKYYEIYSKRFDRIHGKYNGGNVGYCKQPKSCGKRFMSHLNLRRKDNG
jgi:hypothetical protein